MHRVPYMRRSSAERAVMCGGGTAWKTARSLVHLRVHTSAAGCGGPGISLHFSVRFLIYLFLCRETLGSEEEEEE